MVRRMLVRTLAMSVVVGASAFAAPPVAAQARPTAGPTTIGAAPGSRLHSWSVLAPLADLPREFPGWMPVFGGLLDDAPRGVGPFETAGNPGGLPFDIVDSRASFGMSTERSSGDYRRPFDAVRESRTRAGAVGRQRLGRTGAGIGSVMVENSGYRGDVHSEGARPYSSSPYAVADTFGSDLDQFSARLEAAGGWRLGAWGVGVAAGFQGQETRTVASPVPRRMRSAGPGVGGGIVRELIADRLQAGVSGHWQSLKETVEVYTVAAATQILQFGAYIDPPPAVVTSRYHRGIEREAWTLGAALSGTEQGVDWVLQGRRTGADERHYNEQSNDPRSDLWRANGLSLGLATMGRLSGTARWSASIGWTALDGEAEPPPPVDPDADPIDDPVTFRVDERQLVGSVGLRAPLGGDGWVVAGTLTMVSEVRDRRDEIVRVTSHIDVRTVGLATEVARDLGGGWGVVVGGSALSAQPVGGIPTPDAMGPAYRRWIGPELAMAGTPATTLGFTAGARWDADDGRRVWLRVSSASLSPGSSAASLPQVPEGDRRRWELSGGVVLR